MPDGLSGTWILKCYTDAANPRRFAPFVGAGSSQRSRLGVHASLPPDHLIYMSRCHDADSNPYFEGSMRVHSVIFLRTSGPRIFFRPVGFLSNLPSRPLCYSDQPITNCRIRPHQFVRYGPYPLAVLALAAGNQDVPGLAGRCRFDHAANIFPAGTGKKSISLENLCSVANRRT